MILSQSDADNHAVCRLSGLPAGKFTKSDSIKLVLGFEDTRCKFFGIVASKDRHCRLCQNWPFIHPFRYQMHGATSDFHASIQCALMGMKPREKRQQGRVNIEDAAFIRSNE